MALINVNADRLGIDDLEIGVSHAGMEQYRWSLRTQLLEDTKNRLEEYSSFMNALGNCWQGASHKTYCENFNKTILAIGEALVREYIDVENRLTELESNYFKQDQTMLN